MTSGDAEVVVGRPQNQPPTPGDQLGELAPRGAGINGTRFRIDAGFAGIIISVIGREMAPQVEDDKPAGVAEIARNTDHAMEADQ